MMTCTENGQRPAVEFNSVLNAAVGCKALHSMLYRGARPQINLRIGAKGQQLNSTLYSMLQWGARPSTPCCIGVHGPRLISESGCVVPAQHRIRVHYPCSIAAWGCVAPIQGWTGAHGSLSSWCPPARARYPRLTFTVGFVALAQGLY